MKIRWVKERCALKDKVVGMVTAVAVLVVVAEVAETEVEVVALTTSVSTSTYRWEVVQSASGYIRMKIRWVKERWTVMDKMVGMEVVIVVRDSRLMEDNFLIPIQSDDFDCC
jgi:hypothetical protein